MIFEKQNFNRKGHDIIVTSTSRKINLTQYFVKFSIQAFSL